METKMADIQAQLHAANGKADALAFLIREIIQISPNVHTHLKDQIPKYLNQIEAELRNAQADRQPPKYLKACSDVLLQFAALLQSPFSHAGAAPPYAPDPEHAGETQNHQGVSVAVSCSHIPHR